MHTFRDGALLCLGPPSRGIHHYRERGIFCVSQKSTKQLLPITPDTPSCKELPGQLSTCAFLKASTQKLPCGTFHVPWISPGHYHIFHFYNTS